MRPTEVVQKYFTAFHARDRETVEALLNDDFTFSSPLDDKIDKACYFERCWPNGEHLSAHQIERLFAEGDEVVVIYSCARSDGTWFRNTEFFRTTSERITQVEVFFGSATAASLQEVEIRALLDEISAATKAKDAAALVAHHAPEVLAFDVVDPLVYRGKEEVKRRAEEWFDSWRGPIRFEMSDLKLSVSADSAFCHSLNHVAGIKLDGQEVDMWWRATIGFSKRSGLWRITHLHSSVPFDTETGTASLQLKPDFSET